MNVVGLIDEAIEFGADGEGILALLKDEGYHVVKAPAFESWQNEKRDEVVALRGEVDGHTIMVKERVSERAMRAATTNILAQLHAHLRVRYGKSLMDYLGKESKPEEA